MECLGLYIDSNRLLNHTSQTRPVGLPYFPISWGGLGGQYIPDTTCLGLPYLPRKGQGWLKSGSLDRHIWQSHGVFGYIGSVRTYLEQSVNSYHQVSRLVLTRPLVTITIIIMMIIIIIHCYWYWDRPNTDVHQRPANSGPHRTMYRTKGQTLSI